jgi:hypothetical protein
MNLFYGLSVGLMIMLSFVGWGQAVSAAIFGQARGDWPFQAVWGTSLLMVFGGVLNMLGLVSVTSNEVLIFMGLGLWCLFSIKRGRIADLCQAVRSSPERVILFAFLGLLTLTGLTRSLIPYAWNAIDDSVAYAAFPVKMLETGALIEPFSWRRLSGFGGYSYLHSIVLTFLPIRCLYFLDMGIMTALTRFAITYYTKTRLQASWLVAGAAGIIFMGVDDMPRINLSPTATLVFLSIGLLETVQLAFDAPLASVKRAWLVALVAAGFASVRVTAIGFEGMFMLLLVMVDGGAWRERLTRWGAVAVLTSLLLVPWAISLYQSSHTPLWPLLDGNFCRDVPTSGHLAMRDILPFIWQNISCFELNAPLILVLSCAAVGTLSKWNGCLAFGAFFTAVSVMLTSNGMCLPSEFSRYYAPYTMPAFIIAGVGVLADTGRKLPSPTLRARFILGLGLCGCAAGFFFTSKDYTVIRIGLAWFTRQAVQPFPQPYAKALATIPPGARVLAEVDDAYLLDYRRHEIFNIDEVGMASPGAGLPVHRDADQLVQYLSRLSIEYIIFVRPAKAVDLYNRDAEKRNLSGGMIWVKSIAPNYLWFFDTVETLARTYPKLFEDDASVVIHLKQPLSASLEKR